MEPYINLGLIDQSWFYMATSLDAEFKPKSLALNVNILAYSLFDLEIIFTVQKSGLMSGQINIIIYFMCIF